MDEVGYRQEVFAEIESEISALARRLPIRDLQFMPVSALAGDMVVSRGDNLSCTVDGRCSTISRTFKSLAIAT